MLGRYPFVEPGQCANHEKGEKQLEEIIAAGLTSFVCLQAELPPQEQMSTGGQNGFLPYRATATLIAAAQSDHPSMEESMGLRTPDLDKFLPPRRKKPAAPPRRRIELDFVHCPVVDLGIPQDEQ
jgi:alanine transaminase